MDKHSFNTNLIVVALAIAFSSFTLWLIESWIKYPLFMFEVLIIIILYLVADGYNINNKIRKYKVAKPNFGLTIGLFLVASSLALLTFNVLKINGGLVQLSLALLCTSFASGYAILNISGLTRYFSVLEKVLFSYILSYVFTGFMTLISLLIDSDARNLVMLSSFVIVGLLSASKYKKVKPLSAPSSLSRNVDVLALLVAVTFFVISFCLIYPSFSFLPLMDSARHYWWSTVLSRTPDLYIGSTYLFAHLHESMLLSLSNSTIASAQTALVTLNLMLPIAFYVMAKQYLEKINSILPSLATVFWVLFSNSFGGFAWLYFVNLKLTTTQTQFQLLSATADRTYNGTLYGILGLWYVPATISFVLLMAAIFLLSKKETPTSKYVALFSIVIAALYLTHVTEAVIFILFLSVYCAISKNMNLKIQASLKASIIGLVLAAAVFFAFSKLTERFIFDLPLLFSISLPIIISSFSLVLSHFRLRPTYSKSLQILNIKSVAKILVLLLTFVYVIALLSWVSFLDSFHTSHVDAIGVVPWFMYPLMLGITGLLSLLALYNIAENATLYRPLGIFIAFMIFAFIAGTIVSTLNLYFFNVGYWEKRFIWFIKIPLAILAPIPVVILIDKLRKTAHTKFKVVASSVIIGTIVLYGISTTFLNVEYWNSTAANPANKPSSAELDAITSFKGILDNDPRAWVATITSTSAATITFAAPADMLLLSQLLYTANMPEMVFTQLYRYPAYTHSYIYLHARDIAYLSNYADSYLSTYIYNLPEVFKNSEVTIYNVSSLSFPQRISETTLIIPFDKSVEEQKLHITYYMLSQGLYNYTVSYDLDQNALNFNTLVLSYDLPEGNTRPTVFQDGFNQTLASWSIMKGNWRIEDAQLMGAESGGMGEGVCLSPTAVDNFTATAQLRPISGNATVANYASIIYSWVDSKNYRVADIYFNADGYIYFLFRDFTNGVETDFPQWPGAKTTLKWAFNDSFVAKLTVNGSSNEISLNDTASLSSTLENSAGKIGLRYYRFSKIAFDDFFVNYTTLINSRPINDYLNYLNSGGRIILLNTDGWGGNNFFANDLFTISNSEANVQQIQGNTGKNDLPYKLPAQIMSAKDINTTTISNYIGANAEIPFVSKKDYDNGGELLYVNVYPLIQAIQKSSNQSAFYPLLGELLDSVNLTKMDPTTPFSDFNGYVREISLKNNVSLVTSSILFPLKLELGEIAVTSGNSSCTLYNVTGIEMRDVSPMTIETDNATIKKGDGLYTDVQLNSPFSIKSPTKSLNLNIKVGNETFTLDNVNSISINPESNLHLQVRIPTITSFEVNFVELYLNNYPQLTTLTLGQNLNVTGFTKFSVMISDYYQAIGNLTLGSSLQSDSQAAQYGLLSTLPTAIFWALLLLPVLMGIFIIFTLKKPLPKNKRSIEKLKRLPKS